MRVIAEIGTAHQGNPDLAEKLIREAAHAGADCAKFQIVFAREILHPLTGMVELPAVQPLSTGSSNPLRGGKTSTGP